MNDVDAVIAIFGVLTLPALVALVEFHMLDLIKLSDFGLFSQRMCLYYVIVAVIGFMQWVVWHYMPPNALDMFILCTILAVVGLKSISICGGILWLLRYGRDFRSYIEEWEDGHPELWCSAEATPEYYSWIENNGGNILLFGIADYRFKRRVEEIKQTDEFAADLRKAIFQVFYRHIYQGYRILSCGCEDG